ncbi:hypothetical protein L218DRAFT_420404 [Marasmius fiardii PR-910]|nr:hypothetical protein L218DRAFT_420404 [Marasmius fiardii PR-910]
MCSASLTKVFFMWLRHLSIFGSLAIIKMSSTTALATTSHSLYCRRWLNTAGFTSQRTVSPLITIKKGTTEYGAEAHLPAPLEDRHFGDPELLPSVDWSDEKSIPGI